MSELPGRRRLAYLTWMPALEAEARLERDGPRMSTDEVFDAILEATGNRDLAEKITRERVAAQLRAGQTPE